MIHASEPYVIIGRVHALYSFHIVSIWISFSWLLLARLMIVCVVITVLPLVIFRWSVKSLLVLRVIPRYLYVSVASSVWRPRVNLFRSGVGGLMWRTLLFSVPNLILYRCEILYVVSSMIWIIRGSVCMRTTSSIHRKHPGVVSFPMLMLHLGFFLISFVISSIKLAYSRTDSIPPWRMLSFMCICLVYPC